MQKIKRVPIILGAFFIYLIRFPVLGMCFLLFAGGSCIIFRWCFSVDREAPANKKNMYQMQKHEHIGNFRVFVAVISAIRAQLFAVLAWGRVLWSHHHLNQSPELGWWFIWYGFMFRWRICWRSCFTFRWCGLVLIMIPVKVAHFVADRVRL